MFWTAEVGNCVITVEKNTKEEAEAEIFSLCEVCGIEGEIVVKENPTFKKEY